MGKHCVRIVNWGDQKKALRIIRETVFIQEQGVPVALEWDEFDETSTHALAISPSGEPIGTARLLPDGHIGRMAVLPLWRRQGYGRAMLLTLLDEAKRRELSQVVLNAQTTAVPFYEKSGFQVDSDEFMEAGIPHVSMIRLLS